MASLTLHQVKVVDAGGTFTLQASITANSVIPAEVFVYESSSGLFSHIATLYDLSTWGTTSPTTDSFYRTTSASITMDTPSEAEYNAAAQVTIINDLVKAFNDGGAAFTGAVDTVLTGV